MIVFVTFSCKSIYVKIVCACHTFLTLMNLGAANNIILYYLYEDFARKFIRYY